jgi:hypothetical protein
MRADLQLPAQSVVLIQSRLKAVGPQCQPWIVAALRKHKFFSLAEVNQAISELLVRLNQRSFRKREGSRATLFAQLDTYFWLTGKWRELARNGQYCGKRARSESDRHVTDLADEGLCRGFRPHSHTLRGGTLVWLTA